jgi:hypothetical protein
MTTEPQTLVTQEMLERKGVWSPARVSPPIALSDIRKWAIAVYWPEQPPRIYWDEEYAKTSCFGGVIAPQDFNPFAWPIDREPIPAARATPGGAGPGTRGMNGGQTDTYGVPMRPGDVISSQRTLSGWEENVGRLGLTLYSYTDDRWTNQNGEIVKVRRSIGIRY